jgi:hypothetical protein
MRRSGRIAVALLSLLLLAATPLPTPAGKPEPQDQAAPLYQAGASDKQSPTASPSAGNNTPQSTTSAPQATPQTTNQPTKASGPVESAQWWFNLFLVVFTFGLVVVGALQVWLLAGSLVETRKAADAAKKSADVAEETLRAGRRPWVVRLSMDFRSPAPLERPVTVDLVMKNYGGEPAINTRITLNWRFSDPDFPSQDDGWTAELGIIAPGEMHGLGIPLDLKPEQRRRLFAYDVTLSVRGLIEYGDRYKTDPHYGGTFLFVSSDLGFQSRGPDTAW